MKQEHSSYPDSQQMENTPPSPRLGEFPERWIWLD